MKEITICFHDQGIFVQQVVAALAIDLQQSKMEESNIFFNQKWASAVYTVTNCITAVLNLIRYDLVLNNAGFQIIAFWKRADPKLAHKSNYIGRRDLFYVSKNAANDIYCRYAAPWITSIELLISYQFYKV